MRPYIWSVDGRWFVGRHPSTGWGSWFYVFPGTLALGYPSLGEAMNATLHALAQMEPA